mmetsp:Transcript_4085/g.15011  ORF Transcript_4085/g.15011 Transcript_4085/m.15011 type:complete len:319 (-) Transcript_4085:153-1109(-)
MQSIAPAFIAITWTSRNAFVARVTCLPVESPHHRVIDKRSSCAGFCRYKDARASCDAYLFAPPPGVEPVSPSRPSSPGSVDPFRTASFPNAGYGSTRKHPFDASTSSSAVHRLTYGAVTFSFSISWSARFRFVADPSHHCESACHPNRAVREFGGLTMYWSLKRHTCWFWFWFCLLCVWCCSGFECRVCCRAQNVCSIAVAIAPSAPFGRNISSTEGVFFSSVFFGASSFLVVAGGAPPVTKHVFRRYPPLVASQSSTQHSQHPGTSKTHPKLVESHSMDPWCSCVMFVSQSSSSSSTSEDKGCPAMAAYLAVTASHS